MLKIKKYVVVSIFAIVCCIAFIPALFPVREISRANKIPKAILQKIKIAIMMYQIDYDDYPSDFMDMYAYIKDVNVSGDIIAFSLKRISKNANEELFLVEPYKNIRLKYYPQHHNDEKSTIVELNAGGNLFLLSNLDIEKQLSFCKPVKKH